MVTRKGKAIRYPETTVRVTGRMTAGVRAMNLADDDSIAQMLIFDPNDNPDILVVTEMGFGKRTESSQYRCYNGRYTKGVDTINKVKFDRNGYIIGACSVMDDDTIIMLTTQGKIIQVPVDDIRAVNRVAMGVRVVKLDKGDTLTAITKVVDGAVQLDEETE
jgi:DNA gyrase subunit A